MDLQAFRPSDTALDCNHWLPDRGTGGVKTVVSYTLTAPGLTKSDQAYVTGAVHLTLVYSTNSTYLLHSNNILTTNGSIEILIVNGKSRSF